MIKLSNIFKKLSPYMTEQFLCVSHNKSHIQTGTKW